MIGKASLVAAILGATLSACTSSTDGSSQSSGSGSGSGSGLSAALGSVSVASISGPDEFQYGDIARERELGIVKGASGSLRSRIGDLRWGVIAGFGAGSLVSSGAPLGTLIGADPLNADTVITAGMPPNMVTRLSGGYDSKGVTSRLEGLGAKPRTFGTTKGVSFAGDNQFDTSSQFVRYGLSTQLNQVIVDKSSFSASPNGTALQRAAVRPSSGKSLLDNERFRGAADCLGDVIAADIVEYDKPGNSSLVAIGERDPGSLENAPSEVVCMLPSASKADAVRSAMTTTLALDARDPLDNLALSTRASASKIDTSGSMVRAVLTMKAGRSTGYVFLALERNVARFWDGTCAAAQLRQRSTC